MPNRMEFSLHLPKAAQQRTANPQDEPLRFLILGDFSGRSGRETAQALDELPKRRMFNVDVDNLDTVLASLAPQLHLTISGSPVYLHFQQCEDFHPDALLARVEIFQTLRNYRAQLLNPTRFDSAVAELTSLLGAGIQTDPPPPHNAEPSAESAESAEEMLARLFGAPATASASPRVDSRTDPLQGWLRSVVQAHIVHTPPNQAAWIAAVDAALSTQLRDLLHAPAFQALEATWRSVQQLVNAFDSTTLQVTLFDVTRQELLADLRRSAGNPHATGLHTRLIEQGVRLPDGEPWSLLIADYSFGSAAEDIALLAALGALAVHAGGPLLAGTQPALFDAQAADPSAEQRANWQALRQSAVAPWLGLVLPRVLLRLPYGGRSDPLEQMEFEEMGAEPNLDDYLWGNPAFIGARLIASAFAASGAAFHPDEVLELDDLPAHIFERDGERVMQPVTETLYSERAMQELLANGLMPLLGHRQRHALRLTCFQSLADPATELAGVWSR